MAVKSARKKMTRTEERQLDIKIGFLEGLIRRDSEYVDALQLLGDYYTQRGRYAEGLQIDERLARLVPGDAVIFYNLACSYSLTDEFDSAAQALEKAIHLGYRDFSWIVKDPDLRKFREHPLYRELESKIERMKIKVR